MINFDAYHAKMASCNYIQNFLFPAIVACLLTGGCSGDKSIDIRGYYYPVDELKKGLVYEYQALQPDSLGSEYWFLRTIETDTATFLAGQYYESDLDIRQFFREELVPTGALLNDYRIYLPDSNNRVRPVEVDILAGNAFPFRVRDSLGVFLFKISWPDPADSARQTTLIRNRRFLRKDSRLWNGRKWPCVVFQLKEVISDYKEGYLELELEGEEWYGEGVGLIYYYKKLPNGAVLEYELKARYDMETFEQDMRPLRDPE